MSEVRIWIKGKNKYVGSMIRGLATQIGGTQTATGNKTEVLEKNGYFTFKFSKESHADDFKALSKKYLGEYIEIPE